MGSLPEVLLDRDGTIIGAHIGSVLLFPHEGGIVIWPVRRRRHCTVPHCATIGRKPTGTQRPLDCRRRIASAPGCGSIATCPSGIASKT